MLQRIDWKCRKEEIQPLNYIWNIIWQFEVRTMRLENNIQYQIGLVKTYLKKKNERKNHYGLLFNIFCSYNYYNNVHCEEEKQQVTTKVSFLVQHEQWNSGWTTGWSISKYYGVIVKFRKEYQEIQCLFFFFMR
jgi:hypothetical protein